MRVYALLLYDHLILSEQEGGGRLMFKSEKKQRGEGDNNR